MFRLPSRQIFKALRSPLRYPLRLSSRDVHTMQVPYTRPVTYDTLARRFSSSPSLLALFINKRQQEARDRGEFIDIHDVGGVDPKDYDVLITDIDSNKLRSEIAEVIGILYLAKASEADANKVIEIGHGIVYGPKFRTSLPCVVSRRGKSYWVFFIVDTCAPLTCLTEQRLESHHCPSDPTYAGDSASSAGEGFNRRVLNVRYLHGSMRMYVGELMSGGKLELVMAKGV